MPSHPERVRRNYEDAVRRTTEAEWESIIEAARRCGEDKHVWFFDMAIDMMRCERCGLCRACAS